MSATLTIRTDEILREALAKRADVEGKTVSELVREILEEALVERTLAERVGHLKGGLKLAKKPKSPWQAHLRRRNWRP